MKVLISLLSSEIPSGVIVRRNYRYSVSSMSAGQATIETRAGIARHVATRRGRRQRSGGAPSRCASLRHHQRPRNESFYGTDAACAMKSLVRIAISSSTGNFAAERAFYLAAT